MKTNDNTEKTILKDQVRLRRVSSTNVSSIRPNTCSCGLSGDTLVMMANGFNKKLKDLVIGEKIVGVDKKANLRENSHKYVIATILNIWKAIKPAKIIRMENDVRLICSDDHQWLTNRGWKYTTGEMAGKNRRPYLTSNNTIRSIGFAITTPVDTEEYKEGYLSGMIRGDGLLKIFDYSGKRKNRKTDVQYQFRFTLKDEEGVERVKEYLDYFNVHTHRFIFKNGDSRYKGIRTSTRDSFYRIRNIIEYSDNKEYLRGYLAGIFDSEGSFSNNTLRITNTDNEIINWLTKALDKWQFNHTEDVTSKTGVRSIRILGGRREIFRFYQLVSIAITRKASLKGYSVKSGLKIKEIVPYHEEQVMYGITTGTGNFIANGFVSNSN